MASVQPRVGLNNPFIALKHANFRFYTAGMVISLIGTWMQTVAQPWLALSLTNSPFLISLIGALQFTPVLLVSLFAGVVIDNFPKKTILMLTQSASLLITGVLAILVWTGRVQFWHILVTATLLGFVNAFDMPTRQSFVVELVGKDDLLNAIGLNSTVFNLSRIIGPALAGVIMATTSIAFCFALNSISFAAVLVSLFFIKPLPLPPRPAARNKMLSDVFEGLRYIKGSTILVETLLAIAIISVFGPNFNVLVPVFAKINLSLHDTGYSFLMSAIGVGSLVGALFVASSSKSGPRRLVLTGAPLMIGLFLILTGITRHVAVTAILLAITGLFFVAYAATANSTLQINASDHYRGRVMSLYALVFAGASPLGNLFAGGVSDRFGANVGFMACGTAVLLLTILRLLLLETKAGPVPVPDANPEVAVEPLPADSENPADSSPDSQLPG